MAIPINYDPNQAVYIARIRMTSQFKGKGEDLDEYKRLLTFKDPKEKRRQIGAIRQSVNIVRKAGCINFLGLYVTNDVGKGQIEAAAQKADAEIKKLDPTYHVEPAFIKLDLPNLQSGNMFTEMLGAIKVQVVETALQRIEAVIEKNESGDIPVKTQNSLLKMIVNVKALNIIGDKDIDQQIEKMRARIIQKEIRELRDDLLAILGESKDRFSSLEILDREPAVPAEVPADPALDKEEDEEKAKPLPAGKPFRTLDLLGTD